MIDMWNFMISVFFFYKSRENASRQSDDQVTLISLKINIFLFQLYTKVFCQRRYGLFKQMSKARTQLIFNLF